MKRYGFRFLCCMVAAVILGSCLMIPAQADWSVTAGTEDYYVTFQNSQEIFLCNEGTIGHRVGAEYYLTYTVESIKINDFYVNGIIATNQPTARFPYVTSDDGAGGGFMNHSSENLLLVEGNTYFIKFTVTEDGYDYRMGWADSAGNAEYIKLPSSIGEVKSNSDYFGVWFGVAGMTGKLTRVRFYDKNGYDLGVKVSAGKNAVVGRERTFAKDTRVDHNYSITLKNVFNVALSNKKEAKGSRIYMEYRVKSSDSQVYQTGLILTNAPKETYPYLTGYMRHQSKEVTDPTVDNGPLLVEGAEYLIMFDRKADRLDVVVQRTFQGVVTNFTLDRVYGNYNSAMQYASIWFAGTREGQRTNAELENFKCYDDFGNNLGVQVNLTAGVTIKHFGELEDYSRCQRLYACEEDGAMYALFADQTLQWIQGGVTKEGTYLVKDGAITCTIDGVESTHEYSYQFIREESGKEYRRVHTCKATFETRGGTEVATQILDAESGYLVQRPADPTLENNTFDGWYTAEGEAFDFDRRVTKSVTLYAKWANQTWDEQAEPQKPEAPVTEEKTKGNLTAYAVGAALIVLASGVCGGLLIGKSKKVRESVR